METGNKVRYTGEDNEVTMLKKNDTGTILLSHGDGYFEVEFLDVLVAAVAVVDVNKLDLGLGRLGQIALHLLERGVLLLGISRIRPFGLRHGHAKNGCCTQCNQSSQPLACFHVDSPD